MERIKRSTLKSVGDYFVAFDERATGGSSRGSEERDGDDPREGPDGACGFCLAACVVALGFFFSAASTAAATPF